MNLLDHFPQGVTPRSGQIKALQEIENAKTLGKKIVILRAPTGSGKSWIAKAVANSTRPIDPTYEEMIHDGSAFDYSPNTASFVHANRFKRMPFFGASILTVTKNLQDQYKKDFDDIVVMKGKSNYPCEINPKFTCEFAPCHMDPDQLVFCKSCKGCPYLNQREEAACATINSFNYSSFFAFPPHLRKRQYIIFDECTELERQLVAAFSVEITRRKLVEHGIAMNGEPTSKNLKEWLIDLSISVDLEHRDTIKKIKKMKKGLGKLMAKQKFLANFSLALSSVIDHFEYTEYLITKTSESFIIEPLHVDSFAREIFEQGEMIILMGATINNLQSYIKPLGIKMDEVHWVDIPSTFPPENSPIYLGKDLYLNNQNLDNNLPTIARFVKAICENHPNEKGLIHSHSFKITSYLKDYLPNGRFIYREGMDSNAMILMDHRESTDPTVLVSPSMTHGVDLKDNLARFQIIIKAPYLPLTNERVKRLAKEDPEWYLNEMLSTFQQACGRGTRSEDDHCVTYVIDAVLLRAIKENRQRLPDYFINRIK